MKLYTQTPKRLGRADTSAGTGWPVPFPSIILVLAIPIIMRKAGSKEFQAFRNKHKIIYRKTEFEFDADHLLF